MVLNFLFLLESICAKINQQIPKYLYLIGSYLDNKFIYITLFKFVLILWHLSLFRTNSRLDKIRDQIVKEIKEGFVIDGIIRFDKKNDVESD